MSGRRRDSRSSSGRSVRHSRGGCLTCKDRRVKCDEGKPHCQRCLNSKYVCRGYESPSSIALLMPGTPNIGASPPPPTTPTTSSTTPIASSIPQNWFSPNITRFPDGNKDPFDQAAIPIGGKENANYGFHRNVYMHASFDAGNTYWNGSPAVSRRHWDYLRDSLCSKDTAFACLARNTSIATFFTDQSIETTNLLSYKLRSQEAIRKKLASPPLDGNEFTSVIWAIIMLACADLLTDPPAVAVHLQFLKQLLTSPEQRERAKLVDACQVACIVAIDVNQAVLLFQPCTLDFEIWFPQLRLSIAQMVAARFPGLKFPRDEDLDEALQDDEKVCAMFQMQNMDSITYTAIGDRSGDQENLLLMDWLSCRQAMIRGTLLNLALASIVDSSQSEERTERVELDTRTFLSLAALHYFRLHSSGGIGNRKMAEYSTFKHYQILLRTMSKKDVQFLAKSMNDNRYFWALYAGAQSHIIESPSVVEQDKLENDWFAQQFVAHIHKRGFTTWFQVRNILKGFWYSDNFEVQESTFVQRMIARRLG